ncbi:TRAP transporter substrate-binding protein [Clostridium sp. AM58-1XD]|uniref:TRAP transporter substrate-binding protein n=1 Tax=Clostridium sp. AM58-1XD TaxID=2292307 RepID=UPI0015F6E9D4|nr:TRAP transporter substrate-binding protein [Clostridium sp. AM58-1XD]
MKKQLVSCVLAAVLTAAAITGCKQPEPAGGQTAQAQDGQTAGNESASEDKGGKAQVITMTFALAENSPHHKAGLEFARLVEEKTNGAYKVEVYPNSALASGNQLEAIQMVQNGSISCGWVSPPVQTAIEPSLNALSIPWLWKDTETIDATLQPGTDVDKELNRLMNAKGYEIIGYAENGYRELTNSVREIRTPADMKNLKFRVIGSPMLLDVFKAMGANPVDLNFGELFTALQQKTVDGQENPISTAIIPQRFYEAQKYLTVWNYSYEPHPLEFNKKLWDSFDPETQEIFRECAAAACTLQKKLAREALEADMQTLRDAGVVITELTDEEKQPFKEIAAAAAEKSIQDYDQALVEALYNANK